MNWFSLMIPSQSQFDNTVKDILKRAEYKHLKNNLKDLYEDARERIGEMLSRAFSGIPDSAALSKNLSTAFIIIGLIVILAIIIIIVVKVSRTLERKGRIKEILGEQIEDNTTPKSLRLKAAMFEKEGDYRTAIRYDFIALLLLMHERNLLYLDETKTNAEIHEYLRKNTFPNIDTFKYLSNIFNSAWYGHKGNSEDTYRNWNNNINLLWNEVIDYEEKNKQ